MLSQAELIDKLKNKMSEQNITQAELSRLLDVNPSTVCNWLNGKRKVNLFSYIKINAFLSAQE